MIDRSLNYGRHHIARFFEQARPWSSVLDLGAGHGDDLALARKANPSGVLHGVEVYEQYAQQLRSQGVTVHALDIERDALPFADGTVDVVLMNQVLEHLKDVFWVMHEATRVLPVGGKLLIGVPNLASLHNRLLLAAGEQPSPIKTNSAHVRGFTRPDIERFLEACFPGGYALRDFGGSNFYPLPPPLARPMARLFPTLAWGIFFAFEKRRAYGREFLEFPVREQLETHFWLGPP